MFGIKKLFTSAKQVKNKDILEAIIAASLIVAAADGEIERKEIEKLEKLLINNDSLSSFKPAEIRKIVDRYSGILEADFRVGKLRLMKELNDISDNADQCEEVFVNALAIAESGTGKVDDEEAVVLKEIGKALGINLASFGLQ